MTALLLAAALLAPLPARAASTDLTIPSDGGAPVGVCDLGATLDRPAHAKAIVVLVCGSGTHDRDETVGPVKPFRDLADALAARGIATLRYDKRGFSPACRAAALSPDLTPDNFVADVVHVYRRAEAEGLPVFVLGHSEGVTYVDEAAARGEIKPRGLILLSGLGRYDLAQTLLRQFDAALKALDAALAGSALTPARRAELERSKARTEAWRSGGRAYFRRLAAGKTGPGERYLGAYARFWREIIAMTGRAAATAAQVPEPALVLRGTADRNVTHADWQALAGALKAPGSSAWEFPGLDHLYVAPGTATVAPEVPRLIADWIDARLASAPAAGRTP
ncbi:MAG: alpha/beta fold hydrolase [Elusimicrobia bacterium]|nr:alpha/beta fold hydrolase [Elusimicrobiota bacterium]